ncbi:MAG: bifunctional pyr operon transcriptional regulator/uracil phosphoribosyltransferase PyrR [Deltaproteobacteria bacterium CG_4_8_14_3_um_filter_51_11]|nr:bifunctional pyr operon transcriptional regulator/uracil phosphoribosyltransferase PyrR [bacterium]OIP40405.1 MAG: bifunctional pyr operon transcriptional regulator/uracil phosphoribosyltransferase [Desulfobacteraceae bacterium CG2_30_51_40]PIP44901.1 MAG: bifunctional pyr operon transcriptional regulator/uracil phosphoribosyltransferase [Deltaproteobacteria bacterium CG23_combo_of_CG06-09_8_20_14_all_51_20]PIV99265.1 MAG: bifunctional pyr operon transcriptional regulator/uracil phosphoribosy
MKNKLLTEREIREALQKMAENILKRHPDEKNLVLVGIITGGAFLAMRLSKILTSLSGCAPSIGTLDITLYRDDWTRIGPAPVVRKTDISFGVDDRTIVLVDDVIFTGRTVRAAMDALMDYGRPKRIELAVLVDRGEACRELPIMANYAGMIYSAKAFETVNVYLEEAGFSDCVTVEGRQD